MRYGEVWWADLDGRRPVVLVADVEDGVEIGAEAVAAAGAVRVMQVVEPAGVDIEGVAAELAVGPDEGVPVPGVLRVALPRPELIPCTWQITLGPEDLLERAGVLSDAKLVELGELLRLEAEAVGGQP